MCISDAEGKCSMRLKDALIETRGAEWIRALAEKSGLENVPDIAVLAQQTADLLLSEEVMKTRMYVLHDEDIAFLEYTIRNGGKVIPAKSNYACADRLRNIDYAFVRRGSLTMELAEEAADAYRKIDTPQFHELRRRIAWLSDCMRLSARIHGIITLSDFCTMYRKHPDFDDSNEEIVLNLMRKAKQSASCAMVQKGKELIAQGLEETGHEEKLRILHDQVPAGIPAYSEMKDILEKGYPSKTKEYRSLKKYLIRRTLVREDYAEAVLELLWQLIASGNTCGEVLQILRAQAIPIPPDAEGPLKEYLGDAWEATRMLLCNGHTPRDVLRGQRDIFMKN